MDQIEIGREKIGLFFGKEKGPCFNISIRNEEDSHIPSDHGNGKNRPCHRVGFPVPILRHSTFVDLI